MKLSCITFKAACQLTFTKEEVELLMKLSASHYDAHCREVGQVGGFLFGLNNRISILTDAVSEPTLSFREINTLCKILEIHGRLEELAEDLAHDLQDCLTRLNNVCGLMQEVR